MQLDNIRVKISSLFSFCYFLLRSSSLSSSSKNIAVDYKILSAAGNEEKPKKTVGKKRQKKISV